ncbi:hypothetical protein ACFYKX_07925 [Cytobacillus sp. FJAT-54145]|uniref:Uncharacterized protein n=1 Tax=Cytobacillus spartinae TaxID=3299023 RepID=A0ABW6K8L4_9BACI
MVERNDSENPFSSKFKNQLSFLQSLTAAEALNFIFSMGDHIQVFSGDKRLDYKGSFVVATDNLLIWVNSSGELNVQHLGGPISIRKVHDPKKKDRKKNKESYKNHKSKEQKHIKDDRQTVDEEIITFAKYEGNFEQDSDPELESEIENDIEESVSRDENFNLNHELTEVLIATQDPFDKEIHEDSKPILEQDLITDEGQEDILMEESSGTNSLEVESSELADAEEHSLENDNHSSILELPHDLSFEPIENDYLSYQDALADESPSVENQLLQVIDEPESSSHFEEPFQERDHIEKDDDGEGQKY